MAQRDLYLDRIRTWLTILVLLAHLAMTYGSPGGWYYREFFNRQSRSAILLTMFVATINAFSMSFFFLIAGYLTPLSLDRKGYRQFIQDRLLRLGIPLLAYSLLLDPLTIALSSLANVSSLASQPQSRGFAATFAAVYRTGDFATGPLWFVEALLIFNLVYCLFHRSARWLTKSRPVPAFASTQPPSSKVWLISLIAVATATLLLRQPFPAAERVYGFWIGNFVPYIFFFALGIRARRRDWLNQLQWQQARPFVIFSKCAWPALPICYLLYQAHGGQVDAVHGLEWPNITFALWETVIAWGFIPEGLLWFRGRLNQPSALGEWLGRRAYAVYLLHPPVLVAVALLFRHWYAPALVKLAVVSPIAVAATWIAADPFVRLPGLRRIL